MTKNLFSFEMDSKFTVLIISKNFKNALRRFQKLVKRKYPKIINLYFGDCPIIKSQWKPIKGKLVKIK